MSTAAPEAVTPANSAKTAAQEEEYYELLKVFIDTLDQVERNYVDK